MSETPIKLYYETRGKGIPVVLLHGFPLDHTIWYPVVDLLACSDVHVIMPDLRGHGASPAPEGVYSMNLMAEDLRLMLDELDIQKAILVGHSMGGYISLAFSRLYPNRLAGLALVASQSIADSPERRQSRLNAAREVKKRGSRIICETLPPKLTHDEAIMKKIVDLICQTKPEGIIGSLLGMADRPDFSEVLSSIRVPAVVIAGLNDTIIHPENAKLVSRLLGRAWLVNIKDAGHMPMMETPKPVAETLYQLVQKVSPYLQ